MNAWLEQLCGVGFMPHGQCYLWTPGLVWLHAISDGLIALAPYLERTLEDLRLPPNPLVLIAVQIEKPGNLGTILRSADAAGCDAVIVCDAVTDIFNPNVVRASTGVLFSVPIVVAESTAVHAWLKQKGIRTTATRDGDGWCVAAEGYDAMNHPRPGINPKRISAFEANLDRIIANADD